MAERRSKPPPKHIGDYPNGSYWSADPPPGHVEDDKLDHNVDGDEIMFMWDFGVVVPLWVTGSGLVPDEPQWLRRALGMSDSLIGDLTAWGQAMIELDSNASLRTDEAYAELDRRAQALVDRVREELGSRFTVSYRPW